MKIYVYGLGAIGSNLIVQLMKQYPNFEYYGIDFDTIEDRNIGPQAFFREQVGVPKVFAILPLATRFHRMVKYFPKNEKLKVSPVELFDAPDTLIIDCFDNSESRKLLHSGSAKNILHIGFSPFYTAEIIWDKDYDVPGNVDSARSDICEMVDSTPFIHFIVNFAALNISSYLSKGVSENYIITNKTSIKRI